MAAQTIALRIGADFEHLRFTLVDVCALVDLYSWAAVDTGAVFLYCLPMLLLRPIRPLVRFPNYFG